ncbi:fumarate reductase flavoprotein subunit [Ligilactobacillus salitolerans]|uniref:Fumarate reductase flavoprotein subunit n=1 Tax=Ligilactobacillus salitolerans TaxID=1808352 RepID=A0A401IQN4_9LACO|nr:flavocytochrome c [Ligilactobacillus salitolerans]GBG93830.1 fumarate reductase flavoprotein subunit [Ligilactobacillus salitolerans]
MAKYTFEPNDLHELKNNYDVIIVGAGGTGLVAALQAKELGLSPVILEKMERMGGNTQRASSGMNAAETNFQLQNHIVDSFADFYQDTWQGGGQLNDPELLEYFTSHSALAIDWLADHQIILNDLTITGGMKTKRTHRPASKAAIGSYLVTELLKQVEQAEIPLFAQTKVNRLLAEEQHIIGISVSLPNEETKEIHAPAVILATGGFGASHELISKYRPDLAEYQTTNQSGATGDGIELARAIGASLVDMDQIQVHPTVQQETDHAYLIGEATRGEGAILVDAQGQRFVNELDTRKNVTAAINSLPEKSAYLLYDAQVRQNVPAINFYDQIGLVRHGETLAELATNIQVDPAALAQTVETWDQAVKDGQDGQFGRSAGMERTLDHGGYEAIHVAPAVHYTMGGLKINAQAEVLDEQGQPLPGLYAGGEVAGGLHGNNRLGGNSIAETVVFGRQAGQQAYRYLKKMTNR